jgi:hypothetical protein
MSEPYRQPREARDEQERRAVTRAGSGPKRLCSFLAGPVNYDCSIVSQRGYRIDPCRPAARYIAGQQGYRR